MSATHTPGYNIRLSIWFDTDRNGRKIAYYWSRRTMRAIRIRLADAEQFIATETADKIDGHPWRRPA